MISGETSSRPEDVARAFELGVPVGGLVPVRRGDAEAWRLDTSTGSYFVKGYFEDLTGQLAVAMEFERLALEAGVDMPEPVAPADPLLGWVTRIDERLFRVYRWVEHRDPGLDVSGWFGRTMAQVHQLQPSARVACLSGGARRSTHPQPGTAGSPRRAGSALHGRIGFRTSARRPHESPSSATAYRIS